MGRIQEPTDAKMNANSKKRKSGHENQKSSTENSPSRGVDPTPLKDRRAWSPEEEVELVKVLLEHKKEGRVIPMQSKTATYWTEMITLLYPGEKRITQRRLYDKVRRMHHRYNECKNGLQDKKNPWRNPHEKSLYDSWKEIFADESTVFKASQEPRAKVAKVSNGNSVKVVQVSGSSSEGEEEDDHEEEQVPTAKPATPAKVAPKAGPPVQECSGSEEDEDEEEDEEEEDDSFPEKRRPVHPGQNGARLEGTRVPEEELRKTASLPKDGDHKAGAKLDPRESGGTERKEKFAVKNRLHHLENGERRPKDGLDAEAVKSLKAELFQYLKNLRNDCMRELEDVKTQLMNPSRLQIAKRRQELMVEELSLQEKELEISRRYCRLQKEVLKLQPAS